MEKIMINSKFIKRWVLIASALLVILFSCWVVDHLFIMLVYGTDAYFTDHLRVADSKHGILSNGQEIPPHLNIPRAISTLLLGAFILFTIVKVVGLDAFQDNNRSHKDHEVDEEIER